MARAAAPRLRGFRASTMTTTRLGFTAVIVYEGEEWWKGYGGVVGSTMWRQNPMMLSVGFPPVEGPRVGQPRRFNCVTTKSHDFECRVPTRGRATGGAASGQLCDNKIS